MLEKFAHLVRNVSKCTRDNYNEKNDNNSFINYFWCCFRKYRRINYWFHIF